MTLLSAISNVQVTACNASLEALHAQFGAVLASRILESEAADFHWEARVRERYLGQYMDDAFGSGEELSRIAILSALGGHWHVGVCLVDGDARVEQLLWLRTYGEIEEAEAVYARAH